MFLVIEPASEAVVAMPTSASEAAAATVLCQKVARSRAGTNSTY